MGDIYYNKYGELFMNIDGMEDTEDTIGYREDPYIFEPIPYIRYWFHKANITDDGCGTRLNLKNEKWIKSLLSIVRIDQYHNKISNIVKLDQLYCNDDLEDLWKLQEVRKIVDMNDKLKVKFHKEFTLQNWIYKRKDIIS